jgi:hypothetical protein
MTGLVKAGVHDIIGGVEQAVPGQQSVETDIEQHGYQIASIAKALPGALKSDYATRYGGLTNIIRGLYENPLAYISDALMLAGGAGTVAKVGRVGVLGALPTIIPDEAAAAILGAETTTVGAALGLPEESIVGKMARTVVRPEMQLAIPSLGPGEVRTLALSTNPLIRFAQKGMVGLASLDAEDATRLLETIPEAEHARLNIAIATANAYSIPVLKPTLGPFNPGEIMTKFMAGRRLTMMARDLKQLSATTQAKYGTIFEQAKKLDTEGVLTNDAAVSLAEGGTVPIHLPSNAGMGIAHDLPVLDVLPEALRYGGSTADQDLMRAAEDLFGKTKMSEEGPTGWTLPSNRYTERPLEDIVAKPGLVLRAATMDDAPRMLRQLEQRSGMDLMGVVDTTGDMDSPMVEFTAAFKANDAPAEAVDQAIATSLLGAPYEKPGSVIHVSVATPRLARMQSAAQDILPRITAARSQAADLMAEAATAAQSGDPLKAMDLAAKAADQLRVGQAGETIAKHIFDGARREWHSVHDGVPYDPNLWLTDTLRPEHYLDETRPWLDAGFGTMERHMDRTFLPQRVRNYLQLEASLKPVFKGILEQARNSDDAFMPLVNELNRRGLPDSLVEQILGNYPWRGNAELGSIRLLHRMRAVLWDHMVTEGGRGLEFGFPENDWMTMAEELHKAGLPLPDYFPEVPVRSISGWAERSVRLSLRGASKPRYANTARGLLWETQNYDKDLFQVYTRAADSWARHTAVNDLAEELVKRYSRPLTMAEAARWVPAEHEHEVLYPLETVKQQLGLKAHMETDTLANMALGMDPDTAIKEAFRMLGDAGAGELDRFQKGVVVMPKSVIDALAAQARWQIGTSGFIRGYNSLMQLWKQSVLSLRPTWVVNNLGGNNFFMAMKDPAAMRFALAQQLDKGSEAMFRAVFGDSMADAVGSGFFSTVRKGEFTGLTEAERAPFAQFLEKHAVTRYPSQALSWFSGKVFRFNTVKEQAARRGVFLSQAQIASGLRWVKSFHDSEAVMKKLFEVGTDESTLLKAATSVNRVLGDFESFGPIEQYVVRQFLFPFYGFYRHAAKFVARMPFENPYKTTILRQIANLDAQMYQDYPDYLKGSIRVGDLGNKAFMVKLRTLNPLSAFTDAMPITSSLNPLLKIGLERATGVNLFTGQPFEDPGTVFDVQGTKWVIQRDGAGNPIGVKRLEGVVEPGFLQHLGSLVPQLSLIPAFSLYPKSTLLQLASMIGVPLSATNLDATIAFNIQNQLRAQSEMFSQSLRG